MTAYNTIQENLSNIYNILTTNDELKEIKYFFLNSSIYNNDTFSSSYYELNTKLDQMRKALNELNSKATDVDIMLNQCRSLILVEQKKYPKLQKKYTKYCGLKKPSHAA